MGLKRFNDNFVVTCIFWHTVLSLNLSSHPAGFNVWGTLMPLKNSPSCWRYNFSSVNKECSKSAEIWKKSYAKVIRRSHISTGVQIQFYTRQCASTRTFTTLYCCNTNVHLQHGGGKYCRMFIVFNVQWKEIFKVFENNYRISWTALSLEFFSIGCA